MSTKTPPKRLIFRWSTFKGLTAILLFLVIAITIECLVVVSAINLGVEDEQLLQGIFRFPATDWTITIQISPLFHLVPIAVVIALVSSWSYLTKYVAVKPRKKLGGQAKSDAQGGRKDKSRRVEKLASRIRGFIDKLKRGLLRIKGIAYLWREIHFARATIKSGLTVLMVFGTFILLVSLLAYPQLIYHTILNAYQTNPSLLNSMKAIDNLGTGFAETLSPIGWICSTSNTALLSIAPGFRKLTLGLGGSIKPLIELDPNGKYLVFQNIATWISALTALLYGEYRRRGYRYRRR